MMDLFYSRIFLKNKKIFQKYIFIRVEIKNYIIQCIEYELNFNNNISIMPIPVNTDIFFERNKKIKSFIKEKTRDT